MLHFNPPFEKRGIAAYRFLAVSGGWTNISKLKK
jgi:hypothetical protein